MFFGGFRHGVTMLSDYVRDIRLKCPINAIEALLKAFDIIGVFFFFNGMAWQNTVRKVYGRLTGVIVVRRNVKSSAL